MGLSALWILRPWNWQWQDADLGQVSEPVLPSYLLATVSVAQCLGLHQSLV